MMSRWFDKSNEVKIIEAQSQARQAEIAAESQARQSEAALNSTLRSIEEGQRSWREACYHSHSEYISGSGSSFYADNDGNDGVASWP